MNKKGGTIVPPFSKLERERFAALLADFHSTRFGKLGGAGDRIHRSGFRILDGRRATGSGYKS